MSRPRVPMTTLRELVREVLDLAGGYGVTEAQLRQRSEEMDGREVCLSDLRQAMEWNHARAYIRRERNDDLDVDLWFITAEGRAKDNIK